MINDLFLCVGAQKAGTTWLHAQLESHPDIGFSNVKEVHYFNTIHNGSILLTRRKVEHLERLIRNNRGALERYFSDISRGLPGDEGIRKLLAPVNDAWYVDFFRLNTKRYCADFSPEYALIGEEGFRHVRRISERRKIVFVMRDPVSRAKSAIRYFYETQGQDIAGVGLDAIRHLAQSPLIVDMSSYRATLHHLDQVFDAGDVLHLFYEDMMKDKQGHIDRVTDFLGVQRMQVPQESLERAVNATRGYEFPQEIDELLSERLRDSYAAVAERFGRCPAGWRAPA